MATAMVQLYASSQLRTMVRRRGLALVQQPQFRWEGLAAQMHAVLEGVVTSAHMVKESAPHAVSS